MQLKFLPFILIAVAVLWLIAPSVFLLWPMVSGAVGGTLFWPLVWWWILHD